jgi:hypothetical protein
MLLSDWKSRIGDATSEALALAAFALLLMAVTAITPLDSAVQMLLAPLGPKLSSPSLPLWTFAITTGFLTVGLLALMSGRAHRKCRVRAEFWRGTGVFLILLVLIGPALGDSLGLAPSTAGFYGAAGWWIGKRNHPGWAAMSLAIGLILGLAMGLSGMAAGSLRLSEILWSGLAILALAHALYYYVLRLPFNARLRHHPDMPTRLPGLPAMCLLLVVAAVARLPHESRLSRHHWVAHLDAQEALQQPLR